MKEALNLDRLEQAVAGNAAAFRCRRRLQPAGGPGEKISPPTYAGAVYAVEYRRVPDRDEPAKCVLLDSVQSQANRMELALQEAIDAGRLELPLVVVDFSEADPGLLEPIGRVTSLQAPHRLADAILRDSEVNGSAFRDTDFGKTLDRARLSNATPLFEICPTALVFGMWDSTGPKGGLGAKFERAIVSEVVGVGASFGLKTASRIDPIITKTSGIDVYDDGKGDWTLDEGAAAKDPKTDRPQPYRKVGKVSETNLGNVTPAFHKYAKGAEGPDPLGGAGATARMGQIAPGGVTVEYAEQTTTLSLICLRRLRFPIDGETAANESRDRAARTLLAALGLGAATLAFENGMGLRSRCTLWPEAPMEWELLERPGQAPERFALDGDGALALIREAAGRAVAAGLPWRTEELALKPSAKLVELVGRSQRLAATGGDEE